MEVIVEGQQLIFPPNFAVWIPVGASYSILYYKSVDFVQIDIKDSFCTDLPNAACTLALSPLIRAILADFLHRKVTVPVTEDDKRLAEVFIDQVREAPRRASYLPLSDDPLVRSITDALQQNPSDRRSLAHWAQLHGRSERTMSRRFQNFLGISFNEWRQRHKLTVALTMIYEGKDVQDIAEQLGYRASSAFIAMFRKLTGVSPTNM
ncbi:AraC family transcriptional regulator [Pseudomonas veronii]|uniref:AraC family transcriptional regulator n=1 Tax=Pseudomonas veronii TaxID=76761 RepID=UPI002D77C500|nr:AraC family transcriptional regulator [Pseudomonas veronii]WRU61164.1 AraC family transcriptional regulator [Pseudomonas veronii]